MVFKVQHIAEFLEKWAPTATQLDYDNVGLLVGEAQAEVSRILVCLDVTEEVVEEAVSKKIDLIVAHHPLIFKKLSGVTTQHPTGNLVYKLIRHGIHLYAIHTNLDAARNGVSFQLAAALGLNDIQFLSPGEKTLVKVTLLGVNSVPAHMEKPEMAQWIHFKGDCCTFVCDAFLVSEVEQFLKASGCRWSAKSETMERASSSGYGFGAIGTLSSPLSKHDFLTLVSQALNAKAIRYAGDAQQISTVAVCGGAGVFLSAMAQKKKADAYVTSDIKYHEYFSANEQFLLVDAGHYETEAVILSPLAEYIKAHVDATVSVEVTGINTNPMQSFFTT